ncbi:MAG: chemotaxis-specific protein-glutamate methyltransferase CheB [Bacteroidetes bacterium]|nr:chemotaxis-specific protein-glutamate methyltransferase CheB [Bacteroidota bacterium]
MINVLVVEDSPIAQELILKILLEQPDIKVLGVATSGESAIKMNEQFRPDVITMDVNLPGMNGLEATKVIMESFPTPIIIVSSGFEPHNIAHSINAIKTGAVSIAKKPEGYGTEEFTDASQKLVQMIRLMSEIKVVKRQVLKEDTELNKGTNIAINNQKPVEVVGIGASTGGPAVIEEILSNLPAFFDLPVIIVQHIAQGFTEGFVEWLNHKSTLKVVLAKSGMVVKSGTCYIAPDDYHLKFLSDGVITLTDEEKVNGSKPSVSVFFQSLAEVYGSRSIAILLSGMGKDGADQLKVLREKGAITIAQDSSSSLIYGMPGEAVKLKAAKYIMSKENIISFLSGVSIKEDVNK